MNNKITSISYPIVLKVAATVRINIHCGSMSGSAKAYKMELIEVKVETTEQY